MTTGKFIVVEGTEGAGKSTAIKKIQSLLAKNNVDYVNTREPGGTPLAEALRSLVKSVDNQETVTPECELFLMYASRSQLVENVIRPALNKGKWVIGDRHDLSSRAYQGGGRGFDEAVMNNIADIALKGFKPDLTLYLDVPPEIGLQRAQSRGQLDRIELEEIEFFQRVRNKYLQLATQDKNIVTINANQPLEQVHQDIETAITQFLVDVT